jgi:phage anti-repressor protein
MDSKVQKLEQESQRLPSIINHNDRPAVSAYELYNALGFAAQHRAKWYNKNILKNSFAIENQDWAKLPLSGRSKDYALSLDFAKRLSMMARTERGEQIRNYFIQCERQALEATKPRTSTELLLESVKLLHAQESKISGIEGRVYELEAKATTSLGYYGIAGYAALKRRSIDIKTAAALGSKAKAAARKIGAIITTMPDPRFGRVNCYPEQILESVFYDFFNEK